MIRPKIFHDRRKRATMMLAIDQEVQIGRLAPGEPGCRQLLLLATDPGFVPVEIHLLPFCKVSKDVFDGPSPARYAWLRHLSRRQGSQSFLQSRKLTFNGFQ
jgi:hypothetical protein